MRTLGEILTEASKIKMNDTDEDKAVFAKISLMFIDDINKELDDLEANGGPDEAQLQRAKASLTRAQLSFDRLPYGYIRGILPEWEKVLDRIASYHKDKQS